MQREEPPQQPEEAGATAPSAPQGPPTANADAAEGEVELQAVDPRVRLLRGASASEVLEKIARDDPLGLAGLSRERILQQVVLLDPTRVFVRSLARVAYGALNDRHCGRPHVHGWLVARVDQAIRDLVREDLEAHYRDLPPAGEDSYHAALAERLQLTTHATRRACAEFNVLEPKTREVFHLVLFEGRPAEACLGQGFSDLDEVRGRLHDALEVFFTARNEQG